MKLGENIGSLDWSIAPSISPLHVNQADAWQADCIWYSCLENFWSPASFFCLANYWIPPPSSPTWPSTGSPLSPAVCFSPKDSLWHAKLITGVLFTDLYITANAGWKFHQWTGCIHRQCIGSLQESKANGGNQTQVRSSYRIPVSLCPCVLLQVIPFMCPSYFGKMTIFVGREVRPKGKLVI